MEDEFDTLADAVFLIEPKVDNKPKVKSKGKTQADALPSDQFRLDGFQELKDVNEPWEATEIRHALFNREWDRISARIENVMLNMNTRALSSIYNFVENAYNTRITRAVVPIRELPTALVFAGINVPDHDLLFQQIAKTLSSPTPPIPTSTVDALVTINGGSSSGALAATAVKNHVVILQSKDCLNLKGTFKAMIELFLGLKVPGAYNPLEGGAKLQQYDMIVLERWYESVYDIAMEEHQPSLSTTKQPRSPTLVLIFQDFESFDQDILQDVITICSNYQDRIPFVFLMGLATSVDAIHQGLSTSALGLLQTQKFQMQLSSECLSAIVDDLFIQANSGIMVGPLPLKHLIDQFMHWNFSIGGFVANLKYMVMHHYYANPLSILSDRTLTEDSPALTLLGQGHYDHIRMKLSFQALVEGKLETDPEVAELLLDDDEYLSQQVPQMIRDLDRYHRDFAIVFEFLWFLQSRFETSILRKSKRALYFMALEGTLVESSTITFLRTLVGKMNSNDMMVFVDEWLEFFKNALDRQSGGQGELSSNGSNDGEESQSPLLMEVMLLEGMRDAMSAILDVVSDDSAASESESEEEEVEEQDQEAEIKEGTTAGGASSSTVVRHKKRKLVSLNANATESRQTRIAVKTRETARLPKGALGDYTLLVKDVDETIVRLVSTYLDSYKKMPLHELFYYSDVKIQEKAFMPQPRASIQTALGQPEIYLNCECCPAGSSDAILPTQHDTCILYKLYVECGRMINLSDWFTAFGMILERGLDDGGDNSDSDVEEEEEEEEEGEGSVKSPRNGRSTSKRTATTPTKKPPPAKKTKLAEMKRAAAAKKKRQLQRQKHKVQKKQLDPKQVQARFITAVAELQFLGFIKPTNKKTDHVQRLTWGSI